MRLNSISKRLTAQIAVLMVSFSLILLLANSVLLKPFYEYALKQNMLAGMEDIQQMDFTEETDLWTEALSSLNLGHAYDITIEQFDRVIYSSSRQIGIKTPGNMEIVPEEPVNPDEGVRPDHKKMNAGFPLDTVRNWEEISPGIEVGVLLNPQREADLFVMRTTMLNDVEIVLTQQIEPIRESVFQANILLMVVTSLFLVIGIIVARLMAKKFTQPIRDMKQHVGSLSQLEFKDRLEVTTNDELQGLSEDINLLSGKLEDALETLQLQNRQLEKDVAFQKKFISNVSHELRTPLSLIKGYADEIVQGFVGSPEQEKLYMGYIAQESVKMNRLLNEILELSRLESGRMNFVMTEQPVQDAILSFLEKYAGFLDEHQLKVTTDLEGAVACFDPVRFEQILANYIGNAGKYGDAEKKVAITSKLWENNVRITVTNSGGPIDEKIMASMWDGFFKGDEARSRDDSSYGLGLSIVKAIQEIAGEAYGCYNGDGTVSFWFDVKQKC